MRVNREAFNSAQRYERFKKELVDALRTLEDPARGGRLISEIYLREDLYAGPYTDQQPDIIFLFAEGYGGQDTVASSLVVDIPAGGAPGPGHRLYGMYVLWGPGIRVRQVLDANLEGIAPTVYHLLNVPLPLAIDGQVLSQAPVPDSGLNCEARYADYDIERQFVEEAMSPKQQEEQVLERLREVGYIE